MSFNEIFGNLKLFSWQPDLYYKNLFKGDQPSQQSFLFQKSFNKNIFRNQNH